VFAQGHDGGIFGDDRISELANILIACQGEDAENAARRRATRCLRRKELGWAELWRDVSKHIRKRRTPALT
jgi:hypothetical protein